VLTLAIEYLVLADEIIGMVAGHEIIQSIKTIMMDLISGSSGHSLTN
jgi:hypothetical protein